MVHFWPSFPQLMGLHLWTTLCILLCSYCYCCSSCLPFPVYLSQCVLWLNFVLVNIFACWVWIAVFNFNSFHLFFHQCFDAVDYVIRKSISCIHVNFIQSDINGFRLLQLFLVYFGVTPREIRLVIETADQTVGWYQACKKPHCSDLIVNIPEFPYNTL